MAEGHSYREVAGILDINTRTVQRDARWLTDLSTKEFKDAVHQARSTIFKELMSRLPQMKDADAIAFWRTIALRVSDKSFEEQQPTIVKVVISNLMDPTPEQARQFAAERKQREETIRKKDQEKQEQQT